MNAACMLEKYGEMKSMHIFMKVRGKESFIVFLKFYQKLFFARCARSIEFDPPLSKHVT